MSALADQPRELTTADPELPAAVEAEVRLILARAARRLAEQQLEAA
jgi:hypothetical protein